jgi:mycothiol system anti-sigma-R factor
MKCAEIIKLYQLYVDEELDQPLIKKLKEHINQCPDCQYRVKFEIKFKSTITKKIKSNTRSAPQSLRQKILKELS